MNSEGKISLSLSFIIILSLHIYHSVFSGMRPSFGFTGPAFVFRINNMPLAHAANTQPGRRQVLNTTEVISSELAWLIGIMAFGPTPKPRRIHGRDKMASVRNCSELLTQHKKDCGAHTYLTQQTTPLSVNTYAQHTVSIWRPCAFPSEWLHIKSPGYGWARSTPHMQYICDSDLKPHA